MVQVFLAFRRPRVGGTRSLGELACRSPENLKPERCWFETEKSSKVERVHRFSQGLCQRTKGPVDLFKGFQQEPEEPFRLRNWNDPETGRSVDPAEVGGLHQRVRVIVTLVLQVPNLHYK
jgi:hypothetical protein